MELEEKRGKYHRPGTIVEERTPGCYIKSRHVVAGMGFLIMFNVISLRNSITVAIVAMVNNTDSGSSTNSSSQCPDRSSTPVNITTSNGEFNWSATQQGLILGCYFYGLIITCIPGGYLANRFGFRVVIGTSMTLAGILTLLFPLIANISFELFVAARILLGFVHGVVMPSYFAAWGKWAPPLERSKLSSLTLSGASFAMIAAIPASGLIGDYLGWEYIFYITGGFSLFCTFLFVIFVRNGPEDDHRISEQEKSYIILSIRSKSENKQGKVATPWRSMVTSIPVWALVIASFASHWGNVTHNTLLPTYMSSVLKFNLSAAGALSSLPNILKFCFMLTSGSLTDVIRKKGVNVTALRKINTSLGLFLPALFLVLAGYIGCDVVAATVFFTLSKGFTAFIVSGPHVNCLDIAPKYAGILFGLSTTAGSIAGFLAPQVAGLILNADNSIHQWQIVFWLLAGINVFGGVVYIIFGTGKEQLWATGKLVGTKGSL